MKTPLYSEIISLTKRMELNQCRKTVFLKKFALFIVLCDLIYSLLTWFLINFHVSTTDLSFQRIFIFCFRFLFTLLLLAIGRAKTLWMEKTLACIFFVMFYGNFVDKLLVENFCDKRRLLDLGLTTSFNLGYVAFSGMKFRYSLTVIAVMVTSMLVMIPYFIKNEPLLIFCLTSLSMYSLIVLGLCYLCLTSGEIKTKERTKKQVNSSDYILKALLKDILPWSIVIVKNDELLYANKNAIKMFAGSHNGSILETIKDIKLWEKNSQFRAYKQEKILSSSPYFKLFRKTLDNHETWFKKKKKNQSLTSLRDVIAEKENNINKIQEKWTSGLLTFYGSYKSSGRLRAETSFSQFSGFSSMAEKKYFEITIADIEWEEVSAKLVIFCEDDMIRKLKQLQRQSKFKDQMLATVGHNLRTPLNGIFGMLSSQPIATAPENAELIKSQKYTKRFADILLHTIKDIENYNLFVLTRLEVHYQSFSLTKAIKEIIKLYRFQAKRKGVSLEYINKVDLEKGSDIVENDYQMVKQVIFNLLSNAIKFTNKGFVKVTLDIKNRSVGDSEEMMPRVFTVLVEDSGSGINQEQKVCLFKLFTKPLLKNNKISGQPSNGIGLGLTMSQILVKLFNSEVSGYEIQLQSELGVGSTFEFPIFSKPPMLHHVSLEEAAKREFHNIEVEFNPLLDSGKSVGSENISQLSEGIVLASRDLGIREKPFMKHVSQDYSRVLLVDDDQINVIVGEKYLKQLGYQDRYDVALNGLQALEKAKELAINNNFYKFILMDCNMPVMDGFEATMKIRELHTEKNLPAPIIIASTANHSQQDLARINECGMLGCLIKPYKKEDLLNILEKLLS